MVATTKRSVCFLLPLLPKGRRGPGRGGPFFPLGRAILFLGLILGVWNTPAADHGEKLSNLENRYYEMVTFPIPKGITLEAGALQFLPDGRLASATRFGDIYIIENPLEKPPRPCLQGD